MEAVKREILDLLKRCGSPAAAARAFAELHASDTKTSFYPLISHLFQILGYRSDYSRAGVNYQRWDACVWLGDAAIPSRDQIPNRGTLPFHQSRSASPGEQDCSTVPRGTYDAQGTYEPHRRF